MLTSAKLIEDYLVVGITRELNKKPSLYCYPIYINYMWSVLQQCPTSIPILKASYLSYVYSAVTVQDLSRTKEVDLTFFIFFSHFHFLFDLFSFLSIFRTSVRVRVTKIMLSHSRSHHMTWSQVTWCMEGWYHTTCETHIDLKAYIWLFRMG